jgi:hypothetical protein
MQAIITHDATATPLPCAVPFQERHGHAFPSFKLGPSRAMRRTQVTQGGELIPTSEQKIKNKAVRFGQRPRPLYNRYCRYTRTGTCFHWGVAVARYPFYPHTLRAV